MHGSIPASSGPGQSLTLLRRKKHPTHTHTHTFITFKAGVKELAGDGNTAPHVVYAGQLGHGVLMARIFAPSVERAAKWGEMRGHILQSGVQQNDARRRPVTSAVSLSRASFLRFPSFRAATHSHTRAGARSLSLSNVYGC